MSAALWPLAAVVVASLLWDVARRHIGTRQQWNEKRMAEAEAKLEGLREAGKVLKNHEVRLAGVERWMKNETVAASES